MNQSKSHRPSGRSEPYKEAFNVNTSYRNATNIEFYPSTVRFSVRNDKHVDEREVRSKIAREVGVGV